MKKYFTGLFFLGVISLNAVSLDDIIDSVIGGLDKKFDNLFSNSLSAIETCYGVKIDYNTDFDLCKIASAIDKIRFDSCSIIGGDGGREIGISGASAFCKAQLRKFSNYASKQAGDFAEYSSLNVDDETKQFLAKLPNGQDVKTYLKTWDVNSILSKDSDSNIVTQYLKQRNEDVIALFMDYSKTSEAKTDPSTMTIEDLKAPASLEEYKSGVAESVRNYKKILNDTNPNQMSSLVRSKLQSEGDNQKSAQKIIEDYKKQFDLAKNIEIGQALSASPYKKIAIPTQEYVQTIRRDLRPQAIADIRKQQAYEIAKIAEIEEKWQRKYEITKLLADKEAILAQKFDENSAREEIEKIINQANDI
ncbi:hypothetical protein FQW77_08660 [Campylobacter jejuni]|nr:hypothetical protein [Campylobacter jejuni]